MDILQFIATIESFSISISNHSYKTFSREIEIHRNKVTGDKYLLLYRVCRMGERRKKKMFSTLEGVLSASQLFLSGKDIEQTEPYMEIW